MTTLLLLAVVLQGPPDPPDYRRVQAEQEELREVIKGSVTDGLWIGLTGAADLYSTAWALRQCEGNCSEGNPAGFSPEARIALKAGGILVASAACYKLRSDGHPKWARGIRIGMIVLNAALVTNNVVRGLKK